MTLSTITAAYESSGGAITGEALAASGSVAWGWLIAETLGKILQEETVTEELLQCFSALMEWQQAQEHGGNLASQTVGDWKQEYRDPAGGRSQTQQAGEIIRRYLTGSPLLYRGWPQ